MSIIYGYKFNLVSIVIDIECPYIINLTGKENKNNFTNFMNSDEKLTPS